MACNSKIAEFASGWRNSTRTQTDFDALENTPKSVKINLIMIYTSYLTRKGKKKSSGIGLFSLNKNKFIGGSFLTN